MISILTLTLTLTAVLTAFTPLTALPCSSFSLDREGVLIMGRNLDTESHADGILVVNKRGVQKTGRSFQWLVSGESDSPPIAWVSQYGSISFNATGVGFPESGLNEAGLAIEEMPLLETEYPSQSSKPKLFMEQWVQYVLDTCATVDEVVESAQAVAIDGWNWHFYVVDKTGDSAVIEFLDGESAVRRGRTLPQPLLCNSIYDEEMVRLASYEGFGGDLAVESNEGEGSVFSFTVEFNQQVDVNRSIAKTESYKNREILAVTNNEQSARAMLESVASQCTKIRFVKPQPESILTALNSTESERDLHQIVFCDCQGDDLILKDAWHSIAKETDLSKIGILFLAESVSQWNTRWLTTAGFGPYQIVRTQAEVKETLQSVFESCLTISAQQDSLSDNSTGGKKTTESDYSVILDNKHVLLVEDDPTNQMIARRTLEKLGLQIDTAENGQEALDRFEENIYDLVLMDCKMPVMDGFYSTREIRHREQNRSERIPVVALTARAMRGDRKLCENAGMDDYLTKPISIKELRSVLQKWLQPVETCV